MRAADVARETIRSIVEHFLRQHPHLAGLRDVAIEGSEARLIRSALTGEPQQATIEAFAADLARAAHDLGYQVDLGGIGGLAEHLVTAVRYIVSPIADPAHLRSIAEALEELFPEDHDSDLARQQLLKLADRLDPTR